MAQQARPKVIGQMLAWRAQLMGCSTEVVMTFSSKRPSIQGCVGIGFRMFCRLMLSLQLAVFLHVRGNSLRYSSYSSWGRLPACPNCSSFLGRLEAYPTFAGSNVQQPPPSRRQLERCTSSPSNSENI